MPSLILITPTTDAATVAFIVSPGQIPMTVTSTGLAGAESIAIEIQTADAWDSADDDNGPMTLTATRKQRTMQTPGHYRLVKPETASNAAAQIVY